MELLVAADKGEAIAPSKITVGQHVAARIEPWRAAGRISGRTRENYKFAAERLEPLGDIPVQQLDHADIERGTAT